MKQSFFALALVGAVAFTGCAGASAELESKIADQKQALTDTIGYYTQQLEDMRFQVDSLQAVLASHAGAVSGGGTAPKAAAPAAPAKPAGSVDVGKKGTTEPVKVEVGKKGSTEPVKVNVSGKGKGGGN